MASKTSATKKKQPAATETSESIEAQVEAFLKSGGEIQQIQPGVSGQASVTSGRKQISLGSK